MKASESSLRTLFGRLAEMADRSARLAFLEEVCRDDPGLRERLEALLRAHEEAGGFLSRSETGAEGATTGDGELGDRIGRYRLVKKLGEGGSGVVYLAEQEKPLKRRVALKVIRRGMDSKTVTARFELERQALALMDHPCIAKVWDAGTTGSEGAELENAGSGIPPGQPYFVMELVEGPRITDYCDGQALSTLERVALFIEVCRAVQHAHQKGIIHRDLKPSNILVGMQDGQAVPKVIDFGIAKATGDLGPADGTFHTSVDHFLGTPAYMSPEQAGLGGMDIDTRSDIYSLGVLLYELLAGRPPFEPKELWKAGFDEMRRIIREIDPPRPSTRLGTLTDVESTEVARRRGGEVPRLVHALKGDLDWVVMKCLEKDRSRRYETANGLATDLRRHLQNEPVAARPPSGAYRLGKIVRRNRLLFASGAVVALALMVGLGVSVRQTLVAGNAREELRNHLYASDMGLAFAYWASGNATRARDLLERQRPETGRDLRGFEWRMLHRLTRPQEERVLQAGHPITRSAISPDGRFYAAGMNEAGIRLWESATGREVISRGPIPGFVYSIAFTSDGRRLAYSGYDEKDHRIHFLDLESQTEVGSLTGHTKGVFCFSLSPDDTLLVSGAGHPYEEPPQGELFVWDVARRLPIRKLTEQGSNTTIAVDFSPDGSRVATAHGDGTVHLWSVSTWKILHTFREHRGIVTCLRFSPDGVHLASGGKDGSVRLWDLSERRAKALIRSRGTPVISVAFSADGKLLAYGGLDMSATVWSVDSEIQLGRFLGSRDRISSVGFTPDGRQVVAAGMDGTARFYAVPAVGATDVFDWHKEEGGEAAIVFSPDGRWMSRAHWNKMTRVTLWNALTLAKVDTMDVAEIGFSFDGKHAVTTSRTNAIRWYDASGETLRFIREIPHELVMWGVPEFSSDHRWLAVRGFDQGVHVLVIGEIDPWREVRRIPSAKAGDEILGYRFSPDGRLLAVPMRSERGWRTGFWRTADWTLVREIPHDRCRMPMAFSPDWRWMAMAMDGAVRVIDLNSGQERTLVVDAGAIGSLAFAPDGRSLAAATHLGLVLFWSLPSWREVTAFAAHDTAIRALGFSPDGTMLASVCLDRSMKLWTAPKLSEIDGPRTQADRNPPER